jgi:uncharacterized protein (TIGR04255 family)
MTFSNPPIVEAIFHVVVERDNDFNNEALSDYAKYITESFPVFNRMEKRFLKNDISFNINDPGNITSSISDNLEGYFLSSNDNSKVIQANLNDFSFSKLQPYETWEAFYHEASNFWKKYIEITSVERVKRLGLRYLNRIEIPFDEKNVSLQDYVKIFPEVSDDLSMIISGYFMQISLFSEKYKPSKAIVNQTIGGQETSGDSTVIPLIFDIEVFQDVDFVSQDNYIDSIFINNLRLFKNDIFLNGITKKSQKEFSNDKSN